MDRLMVDGNAAAGLLQEVFAVEMTTAIETCGSCGAAEPVGALHVFRGAGVVMRCPHCDAVVVTIVKNAARAWVGMAGVRTLEVDVSQGPDQGQPGREEPPEGTTVGQ